MIVIGNNYLPMKYYIMTTILHFVLLTDNRNITDKEIV